MSNRKSNAEQRLFEERIYAQVVDELAQGNRRDGLWAKAISESGGSIDSAKGLYIRYRAQSIMDEIEISARRELEKSKAHQEKQDFDLKKAQQEQSKLKHQETTRIVKKIIGVIGRLILFIIIFIMLYMFILALIYPKEIQGVLIVFLAIISYLLVRFRFASPRRTE